MSRRPNHYEDYDYDDYDDSFEEHRKRQRKFSPKLEEKKYSKKRWEDEVQHYDDDYDRR